MLKVEQNIKGEQSVKCEQSAKSGTKYKRYQWTEQSIKCEQNLKGGESVSLPKMIRVLSSYQWKAEGEQSSRHGSPGQY